MGLKEKLHPVKRCLKATWNTVRTVSNGKWDRIPIAIDLLFCVVRYKIRLSEYKLYSLYNYSHRYRKHFVMNNHRHKYRNIIIPGFTWSKFLFYKRVPDLYRREITLIPYCGEDAFLEFFKKHKRIVAKPDRGSLGEGIKLLDYTDDETAKAFFASASQEDPILCEEYIKQHKCLKQLNPYAVNTLRVTTLLDNGEVEIISAVLKIGTKSDGITDNMSGGGIGAQIDIDTGVVSSYGKDFKNNKYVHHPISGEQIIGLQIPYWDKVIDLVKELHMRLPQNLIYGWDVAITEDGVDLVEANSKPGSRIMQSIDCVPRGQKILPLLKKDRLKDVRENCKLELNYSEYFQPQSK